MNKNIFVSVIVVFLLCFESCALNEEPHLLSLRFTSDDVITFTYAGYQDFSAYVKSMTDSSGKNVKVPDYTTGTSGYTGKIKFKKKIDDGSVLDIDFSGEDNKYLFTARITK